MTPGLVWSRRFGVKDTLQVLDAGVAEGIRVIDIEINRGSWSQRVAENLAQFVETF